VTSQLSFLPDPIDQAFVAFHHANPQVYRQLVGLAREWKKAGHSKCSINMLFKVLRWDEGIRTKSADGVKLNNSFRSRYARLVAANHPDLAGLFETRALASERGAA
jgi:hypothetical protein